MNGIEADKGGGESTGEAAGVLSVDYFEPHVGKIFSFRGTRYAFPLNKIVSDDRAFPDWIKRRPFMLIFRGPKEAEVLPEGLYVCEIAGGPAVTMHVAPIFTPQPDCQEYQAAFN
ncbi:DUF6916 family protein [Labrys okinawensis]|uniref:DUF6916 family protein n=1 Tax=Labrys okinawensis TaxID=346911 RepID=UPI0039BD15C1